MLIDPARLARDRAARWEAIDSLRLPSGRGADGRGVSAATLKSVLRFVESKEGNNGKEWHSLPHMAEIMGLKGTKTLERALYALRMMGLLSINDTSRGGKRCLEKSINWQRVFRDEPIVQAEEQAREEFTTETQRHGDHESNHVSGSCSHRSGSDLQNGLRSGSHLNGDGHFTGESDAGADLPNRAIPFGSASVPPCLRGESVQVSPKDSDTTTRGFRHSVGTDSDTDAPQTGPECRNPTICSIIKQTSNQTSTEPGEWMGEDFQGEKKEGGSETCLIETTNPMTIGKISTAPMMSLIDANTALGKAGESSAPTGTAMIQSMAPTTARYRGVPVATEQDGPSSCLRGESLPAVDQPSTINHQPPDSHSRLPSPDSPMRTIDPREAALIRRMLTLGGPESEGIHSAKSTLLYALRIGHSIESVTAILDHFDTQALTDPKGGHRVNAWELHSVVVRLKDEDAVDLSPAQGRWGPKRGEWTALKLRLAPTVTTGEKPRGTQSRAAVASEQALGRIQCLSKAEVIQRLTDALPGLPEGELRDRVGRCLGWLVTNQWGQWCPEKVARLVLEVEADPDSRQKAPD